MNLADLFQSLVAGMESLTITYAGYTVSLWDIMLFGFVAGLVALVIRGLMKED